MQKIEVKNPILRGFHPDPCICKAKNKYHLIHTKIRPGAIQKSK